MTDHDHDTLIARAADGDRAAFSALEQRHGPHLEVIIRKRLGAGLRERTTVEDVYQETLLRAFRGIARFEPDGDPSTAFFRWLTGIAVNVVLEANRRLDGFIALDFDPDDDEISPARRLQRHERLKRFEAALETLRPDYRTALRLVRIEGLSVNEAAERMSRSPNAVSHLLLRGLRKLRDAFGETESLSLPEGADDQRPDP